MGRLKQAYLFPERSDIEAIIAVENQLAAPNDFRKRLSELLNQKNFRITEIAFWLGVDASEFSQWLRWFGIPFDARHTSLLVQPDLHTIGPGIVSQKIASIYTRTRNWLVVAAVLRVTLPALRDWVHAHAGTLQNLMLSGEVETLFSDSLTDDIPDAEMNEVRQIAAQIQITRFKSAQSSPKSPKKEKKGVNSTVQSRGENGDRTLDRYLYEAGKFSLLDIEEERRLGRRLLEGDLVARQQMAEANLRFVISVAKHYQNCGLSLKELIAEGNVGMMEATRHYDYRLGFKFISYAVWWIRQAILKALYENRTVRIPLNRSQILHNIDSATQELEQKLGAKPTLDQIAEVIDMSEADLSFALLSGGKIRSLDAPIGEDEEDTFGGLLEDPQSRSSTHTMMSQQLKDAIESVLHHLTPREAQVIQLYFGLNGSRPHTLEEIGLHFKGGYSSTEERRRENLSRERVRQIKERAIRKLRRKSNALRLISFVHWERDS